MSNDKYITSETDAGKLSILKIISERGFWGLEVYWPGTDEWELSRKTDIRQLITSMIVRNDIHRIPNPDYKEPWPIGTVLKRNAPETEGRCLVVRNRAGGSIKVLDEGSDWFDIHPDDFDKYTPTGDHIDLTPLLGETNEQ